MAANDRFFLALFALMALIGLLTPFVFLLRYRFYIRQFDRTAYQKRFRVGWPIEWVGIELMIISVLNVLAWLQQWPLLRQDQWLILVAVIGVPGILCLLVGMAIAGDEGFQYLRLQSRQRQHSLPDD